MVYTISTDLDYYYINLDTGYIINKYILDEIVMHINIINTCWVWTGRFRDKTPVINFMYNKKPYVKRIIYKVFGNYVKDSAHISNTCGNFKCVNPSHLRLRKSKYPKVYLGKCSNGHLKSKHNVLYNRNGSKICKICLINRIGYDIFKDMTSRQIGRFLHRIRTNQINRLKRNALREWFISIKKKLVCTRCGISDYRVLDFHHINRLTKKDNISSMLYTKSITEVIDEMKKCEVLCKNCHAIDTYDNIFIKQRRAVDRLCIPLSTREMPELADNISYRMVKVIH